VKSTWDVSVNVSGDWEALKGSKRSRPPARSKNIVIVKDDVMLNRDKK